ncbi:MAG TPA: serine hydrolase domain-containing protein [Steroidobacteraceae bacterium]|jgi:CubicO group peptidase (beta-lactamase class C family)|nr:serine hydrolase domain-containing protein [Steroidobacteraceae bacterium]
MRIIFRTFLCFAICLWPISALTGTQTDVDKVVRQWMDVNHVPAISIAVVRHGKPVLEKGYGIANLEWSTPATATTVYQLASVTKQFTATAVMLLVESRALSLDSTVTAILPDSPASWKSITVRHLLNHTSGIRNYSTAEIASNPRKDYSRQEILALIEAAPLEFAPGDEWRYSNSGYFILGLIVEKVSGKDYDTFLRERIFSPLGMSASRMDNLREVFRERASGYTWTGDKLLNAEHVSPTQPFAAGALVASASDLAKWDAALHSGKLLRADTLRQMWAPAKLNDGSTANYGFGWNTGTYRSRARIAHDGVIQGFSSYIARYVDDGVTVVVLMNKDGEQPEQLANVVAALYLPALRENAPRPIADDDPMLTRHLRLVMQTVATGTGDLDWFSAEGQKLFFPDRIKEGKQIFGSHGDLQAFDLMEKSIEGSDTVRGFRAVFGTMPLRTKLTLDGAGKISSIWVGPEP